MADKPMPNDGDINYCTYRGNRYRPGAKVCDNGELLECQNNGEWTNLRQRCRGDQDSDAPVGG
jgi:hypothetical protein